MKNPEIHTFYHPKMSVEPAHLSGFIMNPAKPRLLMEYLEKKGLMQHFILDDNFPALIREDIYIAQTKQMVGNFFDKGKTSRILNIKWTPEYAI